MSAAPIALIVAAGAPAADIRFEQAFATAGEPTSLHYRVAYLAGGARHALEVWRAGDRRLKRLTDGVLATYAEHVPADAGYRLTVLDLKRRTATRIDRMGLYRLGTFTDWFDLGHGLHHPLGAYRLTSTPTPPPVPPALRACRWYDLAQQGGVTQICWDEVNRLPLLIVASGGRPVWRVTAIDAAPISPATFVVRDRGFIRNDAERDLDRD